MSNNLLATEIAPTQTQKEQAINDAVGRIDAAITEVLTVEVDATDTVTLTAAEFAANNFFKLEDDGTDAAVTINVPALKKGFFAVRNSTGQAATIRISGQPLTAPVIADGRQVMFYCDGTNVIVLDPLEANVKAYDFGFAFGDTPIASQVLGRVCIGRNCDTGVDFLGSSGSVSINPAATFDIDVVVNGVSVGTISVSTSGVVTWDASALAISLLAGDVVTFLAPVTPDVDIAGGAFVILASEV